MSAVTATQKATAMYQRAKNLSSGKLELEISWGTIGLIMLLAAFYMGIASTGINTFSKCEEMKGKTVQENLNKYLSHSYNRSHNSIHSLGYEVCQE